MNRNITLLKNGNKFNDLINMFHWVYIIFSKYISKALVITLVMVEGNILHYNLRNINFHNVTHSLISWNPREWSFVIQISLLIVTFLSLISRMQTTKEVNPHPRIAPRVNMWSVTFLLLFFFFLCHLLNVGACIHHISQEGQVKWITLA